MIMIFKFLIICLTFPTLASIEWSVIGQYENGIIETNIHQQLDTGWHTYWKNPGDSGSKALIIPLTKNVTFGDLAFPEPVVIPQDPLITYGYNDNVTYQLPITLKEPINQIKARFDWLECKDICIPKSKELMLNIPKTLTKIEKKDVKLFNGSINKKGNTITFSLPENTKTATFFPYNNKIVDVKNQRFNGTTLSIKLLDKSIKQLNGELFINHHPKLISNQSIIEKKSSLHALIITLLSAFLGGLLLNIMPCVLPIIGIKAIQIQQSSSKNRFKDAAFYWLGIGGTLFTLYGALLSLKLTGSAIGWGFQLQSPLMIQCLIILFLAIMLVNLDIVHISLPKFASKKSNNMILSGILTTIIATPCTAPFLGSALAIALFKSIPLGLSIFFFISIGLALPMMAIIINPKLALVLPKSSKWNLRLKFYLNFGFVATIGWLVWILSNQINSGLLYTFLTSMLFLTSLLIFKSKQPVKNALIILISTIMLCGSIIFNTTNTTSTWQPYSPNLIKTFEKEGIPYLIDVTAKWCVTCQTNKLTVLNKKDVLSYFKEKNIQLIQADWTNKNNEVTSLLLEYNQVSIPTYIYFNGKSTIVFGDILTEKKLKENLN